MKVGVTGATGFVGRRLLSFLSDQGTVPIPLVRSAGKFENEVVIGDISDNGDIPALPPLDSIVHLAARVHVMNETDSDPRAAFRRVNVEGTRRVLEMAIAAGAKRFVYVSSIKAHGESTSGNGLISENSPTEPTDPYGESKVEAEQLVIKFCAEHGLEYVIVRPPLVYGPGAGGNFERLIKLVRSRIPLPFTMIKNTRSLVYLDNLVSLLHACAVDSRAANQVFLACDSEGFSTPALIKSMSKALQLKPLMFPVPVSMLMLAGSLLGRKGEVSRLTESLHIDGSHARKQLDWEPPFSCDKAIEETVKHALSNS